MPGDTATTPRRIRVLQIAMVAVLLVGVVYFCRGRYSGRAILPPPVPQAIAPNEMAVWPWPRARVERPLVGVTRWVDTSSTDGTTLDLIEFDFSANSRLRLELYDQDEDDGMPGDDAVDYWPRGVGQVTRELNGRRRGRVVAAWNGLFFAAAGQRWDRGGIAHHVAPVVLNGRARYNVGNHRWTVGVEYRRGGPEFKVLHQPDRETLEREFTYAAAGAQCLVRDGRPLTLRPPPSIGIPVPKGPFPSTPDEAGYIPIVEHIRTSQTSIGWSRDSRRLYLLIVQEPDHETASILALRRGESAVGGWTVRDLQQFWLARDAWGAVNVDGGNVTQMVCLQANGTYEMVTPRWSAAKRRMRFGPDFKGAPDGGTLMYFYVLDSGSTGR